MEREESNTSSAQPLAAKRDRRWFRWALPPIAAAGSFEAFRRRFQHRHVFLPSRYPAGTWDAATYGFEHQDVWFESSDGTSLHGWWIPTRRPRATVLYCHGNRGSLADQVAVFKDLSRLKINIFGFDYRGYGRSEGEPSESGLFADARAACDEVHQRFGIPMSQIVLFGHSLGGAVAIDTALHRAVASLIVQSSFTRLTDMAKHRFPGLPLHWVTSNHFRSVEKVPRLSLPKLFIHGSADETIPISIGRELYEAAAEPKRWHEVPGAGHSDLSSHRRRIYFRSIRRFVVESVPRPRRWTAGA